MLLTFWRRTIFVHVNKLERILIISFWSWGCKDGWRTRDNQYHPNPRYLGYGNKLSHVAFVQSNWLCCFSSRRTSIRYLPLTLVEKELIFPLALLLSCGQGQHVIMVCILGCFTRLWSVTQWTTSLSRVIRMFMLGVIQSLLYGSPVRVFTYPLINVLSAH